MDECGERDSLSFPRRYGFQLCSGSEEFGDFFIGQQVRLHRMKQAFLIWILLTVFARRFAVSIVEPRAFFVGLSRWRCIRRFPLVVLSGRQSVAEGDGERVESGLPARCPAGSAGTGRRGAG